MFGHQDEPQQPQNNGFMAAAPDPSAAPFPVNPPVNDNGMGQPMQPQQPLLEPQAADGFTSAPMPGPSFDTPADNPMPVVSAGSDDLLSLKQQAMQQLSPLVNHLEQSPEEKFRTTMMMIQASDNQALLKEAFDAANAIQDEKARAQALLDVINEINYFTQHLSQQPPIN